MKKLSYLFFLLLPIATFAQKKDGLVAFSGYKGNYIFNLFKPASLAHPDGEIVGFRLDRKAATEQEWKAIQSFSSPSGYDELVVNQETGKNKAYEYKAENAYNINEVWPIYKKTFNYDSLATYLTQQQLAIAFKILLVDTTANLATTYQYRVVQLKKDGSEYGKYTSQPVSSLLNFVDVNRPKSFKRQTTGNVFSLSFKAKSQATLPQALLIERKAEGDTKFQRIEIPYSIEQNGDSTIYNIVDDNVRPDALYQYTIKPVNRFGGGAKVISDTLAVNSISQKMLLPKAFVAVVDSIKKEVNLSWGFIKPELISMVKIYRSENYEDGFTYVGSTSNAVYVDKTIVPGKKYYYYLMIADRLGRSSERSIKVFALVENKLKPTPPMYVSASKTDGGNTITWQDYNPENRGFKIYKTNQIAGELIPLTNYIYADQSLKGSYSFTDTAKTADALIGYAVVAESLSNVPSDFSKIIYLKQNIPSNAIHAPMLLDFVKDKKAVRLFWKVDYTNSTGAGFNVYRKVGNAAYIKVNKILVGSSKTTYTDTLSVTDTDIFYKISAVSLSNTESDFSAELQVNLANTAAYPPTSLKSYFTTDRSGITLDWQPSQSTVSKYEIYRFNRGEEPVKIGETDKNKHSFVDTTFNKEKTNYYYIVAVSPQGIASLPSNQAIKTVVK